MILSFEPSVTFFSITSLKIRGLKQGYSNTGLQGYRKVYESLFSRTFWRYLAIIEVVIALSAKVRQSEDTTCNYSRRADVLDDSRYFAKVPALYKHVLVPSVPFLIIVKPPILHLRVS